jgi:hypothetical protein
VPGSITLSAYLFRPVIDSIHDSPESRKAGNMPPKKVGNDSSIERSDEYEKFLEVLAEYHEKRG